MQTLLDYAERRPGSLPLLQFALREMWDRQRIGQITRDSYDSIGGIEGALAIRAEAIFTQLTGFNAETQTADRPETERDFRRLFTRLVTLGEGQQDTRRVVVRRELGDTAWSLAQRLANEENRLVVTNAPTEPVTDKSEANGERAPSETVEVVHEALIRHWPRLVEWIDQDRAFQSWLAQIRPNIGVWLRDRSDAAPLLRGGMLAQGAEWFIERRDDHNPEEQAYIEASLDLRRREEEQKEAAAKAELIRQQDLAEAANRLAEEQQLRAEAANQLAAEQRRRARRSRVVALISLLVAFVAVVVLIVSNSVPNEKAKEYPLADGQANPPQPQLDPDPDHPLVVLAFSGGGLRAAALAAAVVNNLNNLHYAAAGELRALSSDISVVSSVSGGSAYAADIGLNGPGHAAAFMRRIQDYDGIGWLTRRLLNPFTWLNTAVRGRDTHRPVAEDDRGPAADGNGDAIRVQPI